MRISSAFILFVLLASSSVHLSAQPLHAESNTVGNRKCIVSTLRGWLGLGNNNAEGLRLIRTGSLTDPAYAFTVLQQKKYFLKQDAWYLRGSQCGGTCASISTANNMLVMAETLHPGSISRTNFASLGLLHRRLMKEILGELNKRHGVDGTKGANLNDLIDVYPAVFTRVFHIPLGNEVSVVQSGPIDFQSVLPGNGSLLILSVKQSNSNYHAVVVTAIKTSPVKSSPQNPIPEKFIITVSDPHAPEKFKDLKVYEHNDRLYIKEYGGGEVVPIKSYGKILKVNAGIIRDSIVINFKRHNAVRAWSTSDIRALIPKESFTVKANVVLKNGTTYNNVAIVPRYEKENLYFFHRFILNKSISLDEVADIHVLPKSN